MGDLSGAEPVDTSVSEPVEAPVETSGTPAPETGGNPAWEPFRSEFDPITYSRLEPLLKDLDRGVQQRFEKNAQEYGWAKDLVGQGLQPEYVQQAVSFAQMVQEQPEAIYEKLHAYLSETGRLPNAATQEVLAKEVANEQQGTDPTAEGADPAQGFQLPPEVQKQLDELNQFKEQQQKFIEEQAAAEQARQEDEQLANEITSLRDAHPEYSDEDIREVLNRALLKMEQTGQPVSLADADQEYIAHLNRIRSTPRPGQLAPTLLPTSGGAPTSAAPVSLGSRSRQETQDMIAGLLTQSKQS